VKGYFLPLIAVLVLAGCRKDQIEVRRMPKEELHATAAGADEGSRPQGLHWTTPAGWKELPANGMRAATFELPKGPGKAEVTVVALPGDVGGELANVNRWRGPLAVAPQAPAPSIVPPARATSPFTTSSAAARKRRACWPGRSRSPARPGSSS
jgi:hypothetical protein